MAELFQFELVSPERQLLSEQVLEVIVPGTEGEFGVLKDHSPFMSTIQAGILKVRREQGAGDPLSGDGFEEENSHEHRDNGNPGHREDIWQRQDHRR